MKKIVALLVIAQFVWWTGGCTSQQMGASDNPNPRRTYNAETGDYQGPTPMPPNNSR
jgi:hypothetical protein